MRDPRVDPREGDVVLARNGLRRWVVSIESGIIYWRSDPRSSFGATCTIKVWRRDCADAVVVTVAEVKP